MSKKIKGKIVGASDNNITVQIDDALSGKFEDYDVIIQKQSKKRGLDANALSWVLIERIAKAVKSSRDEVYDLMLQRYGVATYLIVKRHEAERILDLLEHGRILGDVNINGQPGTQIQVFIGSSNYNRADFTSYLHGIMSECESMGLVIENKDVFASALAQWDV